MHALGRRGSGEEENPVFSGGLNKCQPEIGRVPPLRIISKPAFANDTWGGAVTPCKAPDRDTLPSG
ncbi:MAG: hypothetical protein ACOYMV_11725, partial [Verrucomicrobiia bacterium]